MGVLSVKRFSDQQPDSDTPGSGNGFQSAHVRLVGLKRNRSVVVRHWVQLIPYGYIYFHFTEKLLNVKRVSYNVGEVKFTHSHEMDNPTEPRTLGAFIYHEMTQRKQTAREFARFVGVPHSLINKFLNHGIETTYSGKPVGDPSIDFLTKLARATHTDICVIVALVAPDVTNINVEARLLAERISRLSPERQAVIDSFLLGDALKHGD